MVLVVNEDIPYWMQKRSLLYERLPKKVFGLFL